jgi:hypothetical protein
MPSSDKTAVLQELSHSFEELCQIHLYLLLIQRYSQLKVASNVACINRPVNGVLGSDKMEAYGGFLNPIGFVSNATSRKFPKSIFRLRISFS